MQAYRLGKSRLVVFDDVDLTFTVEREREGELLPVFSIIRAAQRKTTHEIYRELLAAKETPLGTDGPMNALGMQFFLVFRSFCAPRYGSSCGETPTGSRTWSARRRHLDGHVHVGLW